MGSITDMAKETYIVSNRADCWRSETEFYTREQAVHWVKIALLKHGEFEGITIDEWNEGIYVGRIERYMPYVPADEILEGIENYIFDNYGNFDFEIFDSVTEEQENELRDMLTKTFHEWAEKHKISFDTVYDVEDIICYPLPKGGKDD